jgi:antitoxin CcdA
MRIPLRTGVNIMNTTASTRNSNKRRTNVYLTASLVDKARSMDMNLSATLDILLAQAIEAKNVEREEEKEDMQAMNNFMAKAGMLTDDDYFGSL